jgi:sulfide:quinone oxidoreductase
MANVLVLGGGFGGITAAERLAKKLGIEHQITLVSRESRFVFHPAMVRLAFGKCAPDDVSFDLREAMFDRRIGFVQAEVARVAPHAKRVLLSHGEVQGDMPYDYLIFAMGRRLATELVPGFFEHSHHLLTVDAALKFGEAIQSFRHGRVVLGSCPGARLTVPVYETAFALSRLLEARGERVKTKITIVSPHSPTDQFGDVELSRKLRAALTAHGVELLQDFPINHVGAGAVQTSDNRYLKYDLLMLIPPFQGSGALARTGLTDDEGYVRVDRKMRVPEAEGMYSVGDGVNFEGPKMGHMAVHQAEIAADNVVAEIEGRRPTAEYEHEMMLVIDEGNADSIYMHKKLWTGNGADVKRGRFWRWAKLAQEKHWSAQHS